MKSLKDLGIRAIVDDFGFTTSDPKLFPYPGGNMIIGPRSYYRIVRERKAEGLRTIPWHKLERYDLL